MLIEYREQFMSKTGGKKTVAKAAAEKGLYIVTPARKGAGPPRDGQYTESQRSYYARKYMQIQAARSSAKKGD